MTEGLRRRPRSGWKLLLIVLIDLLFLLGIALFFGYRADLPIERLRERYGTAPSQFVTLDGLDGVHLRDEGPRDDPAPIVLLHGTSSSLHTWDGWVPALVAAGHRVLRVDLPGFGLTGPRADGDYRAATYVRFVQALLDVYRLEAVTLGGNSLGGEIAWMTALAEPQRVQRLVLVDPAGLPLDPTSIPLGFRLAATPGINHLVRWITPRWVVGRSIRDLYGDPARVTETQIDRYWDLTLRAGNRAALIQRFVQLKQEMGAAAGRLTEIGQPTLVLWGGKDPLIPAAQADTYGQAIGGSQVQVFPALGHVPQEEDPDATVQVVRDFLARSAAGTEAGPAAGDPEAGATADTTVPPPGP